MLFSSIPFLFYFLPCVFVLYFLVPMRWKNTMLLLASLFFYAWGEPKFVVFMLASIVQGYVLARLVEKYRADRRRARSCSVWDFWATASTRTSSSPALTRSRGCIFRCSAWRCPSASAFIRFRSSAMWWTSTAAT